MPHGRVGDKEQHTANTERGGRGRISGRGSGRGEGGGGRRKGE